MKLTTNIRVLQTPDGIKTPFRRQNGKDETILGCKNTLLYQGKSSFGHCVFVGVDRISCELRSHNNVNRVHKQLCLLAELS